MYTFQFLTHLFLDRFVDINVDVRVECVKRAKEFLKYHPDLVTDVTGEFFLVDLLFAKYNCAQYNETTLTRAFKQTKQ